MTRNPGAWQKGPGSQKQTHSPRVKVRTGPQSPGLLQCLVHCLCPPQSPLLGSLEEPQVSQIPRRDTRSHHLPPGPTHQDEVGHSRPPCLGPRPSWRLSFYFPLHPWLPSRLAGAPVPKKQVPTAKGSGSCSDLPRVLLSLPGEGKCLPGQQPGPEAPHWVPGPPGPQRLSTNQQIQNRCSLKMQTENQAKGANSKRCVFSEN